MVEVHSDRRAHPFSDAPSRYSCRTAKDCRPYRSSHAGCRFDRGESSWFLGCFRGLHWSGCGPVLRVHSCRFVSIGNGFGQPLGVVAVACGVTGGVGDTDGDLTEVV